MVTVSKIAAQKRGNEKMRHLMNPLDFSVEELDKLFALADDIEKLSLIHIWTPADEL